MENTDFMQQYAAEQQASNSSLTETTETTESNQLTQEQAAVPTAEAVPAEQTITPVETEKLDPLQEFARTLSEEQLKEIEEAQSTEMSNDSTEGESQNFDDDVLDEEDFIRERTGGRFNSWEELDSALNGEQQEDIREIEFQDENAEALFNLIAEGKIDEVIDVLYNKKIADDIRQQPDENVLKSYIKFQNPEFDNDDVEAEYEEKYSIDEFAFDESKLKREQKKLAQKIKSDVSVAREFFDNMSESVKFPQYTRPQEQRFEPEVDFEAQEERQRFLESLNGIEGRVGAIPFNWKDDKASLSINGKFEIPAQEASRYREAAESLQDYYAERYYQDGKYQSDKLLKDLYIADNFEKIIQSVISQTANQTRIEMLKQRKNITTDIEQQGTYRPSAAAEESTLLDKLFNGHRQQNMY
jgi:hypothetical protein